MNNFGIILAKKNMINREKNIMQKKDLWIFMKKLRIGMIQEKGLKKQ